jgi:hypothetical protein
MDPLLLTVIIVLAVGLLAVSAYMEWIGLMNLFTSRAAARYLGCGHVIVNRRDAHESCWRCRHDRIVHPSHLIQH